MSTLLNRRDLLAIGATAIAGAAVARRGIAQASAPALAVEDVRGLKLIAGAGANVTVLAAADGALLVDGGLAERSAALLEAVAEATGGQTVRTLFDTNWRAEHTGSNRAVLDAGGDVYAHENTKLWLAGDFYVEWENAHYEPKPPGMLPNHTFYTGGRIDFGGEPVAYVHLPRAHTDGDIYVFLPNRNVLVVGDVVSAGRYPIPDYATGGWIGGLEAATKQLIEIADAETLVVPAEGPPLGKQALETQLELCTAVRERVAQTYREGGSLEAFKASAPTKEFDAQYGDPTLFLKLVYEGAWGHVRRMGGII